MPKVDRPIKMTAETIDTENPEGLENALRILVRLALRKYVREHQLPENSALAKAAAVPQQTVSVEDVRDRKLLDIEGLSKYLSMPRATIYTWVSMRKIPPQAIIRLGRALRFDRVEIDRWLESRRATR